jgi:hypothetical protein
MRDAPPLFAFESMVPKWNRHCPKTWPTPPPSLPPDPDPELEPDPEPEPELEPEPEPEPDIAPELEPDTMPELDPEPAPASPPAHEPELELELAPAPESPQGDVDGADEHAAPTHTVAVTSSDRTIIDDSTSVPGDCPWNHMQQTVVGSVGVTVPVAIGWVVTEHVPGVTV